MLAVRFFLTGRSLINNFRCVTGFSPSFLKTAGWDVENTTRLSVARSLISGRGLAIKPTNYDETIRLFCVSKNKIIENTIMSTTLRFTSSSSVDIFLFKGVIVS